MVSGVVYQHADCPEISNTFTTFKRCNTVFLWCWYVMHSLHVAVETLSCFDHIWTYTASERKLRPMFISFVSVQFFCVVSVHITFLHLTVKPGVFVYIGPVIFSAFFCNKTFITVSTFVDTVFCVDVHGQLGHLLETFPTVLALVWAIFAIGFHGHSSGGSSCSIPSPDLGIRSPGSLLVLGWACSTSAAGVGGSGGWSLGS